MLGDATKKNKYDNKGPRAITKNLAEPGHTCYGLYDFNMANGSLSEFLSTMGYKYAFDDLEPGTLEFAFQWLTMCDENPSFSNDQHVFMALTKYNPVKQKALDLNLPDNRAINEALWKIALDESDPIHILTTVDEVLDLSCAAVEEIINAIYNARLEILKTTRRMSLKLEHDRERNAVLAILNPENPFHNEG